MQNNWSGRRVRRVLKHWYYLDHNFGRLTLNDLKYMEQFYFRMSYLTPKEQGLLAEIFYHPHNQQPHFTEFVNRYHLNYLKFNYAVHKPERQLMKFRSTLNMSMSVVKGIQFRQLADGFHSVISILETKFKPYPKIRRLDRAFNEDFGTCKEWSRGKVERVLTNWYRVANRPPKLHRQLIALVRQLLFRLSYLPHIDREILGQYFYYPTRQQQKQVRSEHLARADHMYLGKLLLYRLKGLERLRKPRHLPKMTFTSDELWQIRNDWLGIQTIIKHSFKHKR